MKHHWTERSNKDFLFRIAADFITQLEDKMESIPISQDEFAKRLDVTKGRVSQVLNNPGNITLGKIIKYSRALGLKVSIVAYEDDDPKNERGPINSEVFNICWGKLGKPTDFWAFLESPKVIAQEDTASTQSHDVLNWNPDNANSNSLPLPPPPTPQQHLSINCCP